MSGIQPLRIALFQTPEWRACPLRLITYPCPPLCFMAISWDVVVVVMELSA